jgi:diguanylate cyclase (GGDEF)-like protein/PAS domain S-box-containing protein
LLFKQKMRSVSTPFKNMQDPHLALALENVTDAVLAFDTSRRISYMNKAAMALTRSHELTMESDFFAQIFTHLDTVSGDSPLARAEGAVAMADPHQMPLRGGPRPVTLEYTLQPFYDDEDRYAGAIVVCRDVSQRGIQRLANGPEEDTLLANEQALFEERERAQVTLNSIGDAVISTDFRGRVSYINGVGEKITGWLQAEASDRMVDEICVLNDAATRAQIPCPTTRAIIDDCTVRIESACSLIRRDGAEIAVEASASPIHDKQGGVIGAVLVAHDVTAARDLSDRLARLALYDMLTDLPNRALFADRLEQALVRAGRMGTIVALLFIDLDGFKPVNDSFGHDAGDLLLKAVARRLLTCVRGTDTVCRHGGDEFIILLADADNVEGAATCANKVKAALAAPFSMESQEVQVTASIGIASFPEHATDAATLLRCADAAMYQAKAAGRNTYQLFSPLNA